MESENPYPIFRPSVLEFLKLCGTYCDLVSDPHAHDRIEFIRKIQSLLPDLYSKALLLPEVENVFDQANEKFVSEEEYNSIKKGLEGKFGYLDGYLEIVEPDFSETGDLSPVCLSEDLSDIYQDLKDFIMLYQVGNDEIMNDAIWECKHNFEGFWGQKLTNAMKQIHKLVNSDDNIYEENEEISNQKDEINTSSWFLNKRIEEFQDPDDPS